ncbi:MAG: hypothetical protein V3W41_16210 [Planctomycetota bacterium]
MAKTSGILICSIAILLLNASYLAAQEPARKPVSKGYVGKVLPALRGNPDDGSRWLGTLPGVSLEKPKGPTVLVVLTSVP